MKPFKPFTQQLYDALKGEPLLASASFYEIILPDVETLGFRIGPPESYEAFYITLPYTGNMFNGCGRVGISNGKREFSVNAWGATVDVLRELFLTVVQNPLETMIRYGDFAYAFHRLRACKKDEFFSLLRTIKVAEFRNSRTKPSQWPVVISVIATAIHKFTKEEFDAEWDKLHRVLHIAEQFV